MTNVATGAGELTRRLCAASPMIARADACAEPGGHVAVVHLDPLLVRSRALQQGLDDLSIAAAAADPRVRGAIAAAVAQVNAALPPGERIVRHEIAVG